MTTLAPLDTLRARIAALQTFVQDELVVLASRRPSRAAYRFLDTGFSLCTSYDAHGRVRVETSGSYQAIVHDATHGMPSHQILADHQAVPRINATLNGMQQGVEAALLDLIEGVAARTSPQRLWPSLRLFDVTKDNADLGISIANNPVDVSRWSSFPIRHEGGQDVLRDVVHHLPALCSYTGTDGWIVQMPQEPYPDQRVQAASPAHARLLAALMTTSRVIRSPLREIIVSKIDTTSYDDIMGALAHR